MKFSFSISLILLLFACTNFKAQIALPILPEPQKSNVKEWGDPLPAYLTISDEQLPSSAKEIIIDLFLDQLKINLVFTNDRAHIRFTRKKFKHQDEYAIDFADSILISYDSERSCMYAIYTLIQSFDAQGKRFPIGKIEDFPKFKYRGMHLDVSRHFFTVSEVKEYLKWMSFYKFNTFHWHLSDDQGWRIELGSFPKLTSIGAVRDSVLAGHVTDQPTRFERKREDRFYTKQEVREVVEYAQSLGIEVIPEIDLPGHASAILAAYPELGCRGPYQVEGTWGVFDAVLCSKPESLAWMKSMLLEILPLFPSKFFHIGGDEVVAAHWESCEKCQKTKKEQSIENWDDFQGFFTRELSEFLFTQGKTPVVWDEAMDDYQNPNVVVMAWRGEERTKAALDKKLSTIACPSEVCYLDHYESRRKGEPLSIGGYTPLEKVYYFNPLPSNLESKEQSLLGAQGNLWTEYIVNWDQLCYKTFPRMVALSEALWRGGTDYAKFVQKMETLHQPLWREKGIQYSTAYRQTAAQLYENQGVVRWQFQAYTPEAKIKILQQGKVIKEQEGSVEIPIPVSETAQNISWQVQTFSPTSEGESVMIDSFTVQSLSHPLIGKKIALVTKPSSFYNHGGATTLVDGKIGENPWDGKEWLGFTQDTVILEIPFEDFSLKAPIKIDFLESSASWIYLPHHVNFSFENKRGKWIIREAKWSGSEASAQFGKKSRKVRIEVITDQKIPSGNPGEGHHPWTFIGEIWM